MSGQWRNDQAHGSVQLTSTQSGSYAQEKERGTAPSTY